MSPPALAGSYSVDSVPAPWVDAGIPPAWEKIQLGNTQSSCFGHGIFLNSPVEENMGVVRRKAPFPMTVPTAWTGAPGRVRRGSDRLMKSNPMLSPKAVWPSLVTGSWRHCNHIGSSRLFPEVRGPVVPLGATQLSVDLERSRQI